MLGQGSFAQVYQGMWNGFAVAIKVIEYNDMQRDTVHPILEASLAKCVPRKCIAQCLCSTVYLT